MDRGVEQGGAHDGDDRGRAGALRAGLAQAGLSVPQLWWACVSIGEAVGIVELDSAVLGRHQLTDHQFDVVAQAINDRLTELGLDPSVPTAEELRDGGR